jgi:hypothetical protein
VNTKTRHEQLIAAGWRYDAAQQRYYAPGAPQDGTAPSYNEAAAWLHYEMDQDQAAPATRVRRRDPRQQEPQ